jgi:hypothetical protein
VQELVQGLTVKEVIEDLATLPIACLLMASADDTSVEAFLNVAPLYLHHTLGDLDTPQYMSLTLACIVATNTQDAARSPPTKDRVLPLCAQPWGPNYYLGDPTLMKWNSSCTLMSKKASSAKDQGELGWVSRTQVTAVSCSQLWPVCIVC